MEKVDRNPNLMYLYAKPKRIYWKIVAGPPKAQLSPLQKYDLVYDEKDFKIRQLGKYAERASRKPAGEFYTQVATTLAAPLE